MTERTEGAGALAIACRLTDPELRRRKGGLLASVRGGVSSAVALEHGMRLELRHSEEALTEVLDLIRLESACCPFLHFELLVSPSTSVLNLSVTGPPGTLEFLRDLGW